MWIYFHFFIRDKYVIQLFWFANSKGMFFFHISQLPGPSGPQATFIQQPEPSSVPAPRSRSTVAQRPPPQPSPPRTRGPASLQQPPPPSVPAIRLRYTSVQRPPPQPSRSTQPAKKSRQHTYLRHSHQQPMHHHPHLHSSQPHCLGRRTKTITLLPLSLHV